MGKVIIIRVDGTIEENEQSIVALEDVQGIVGGYIENIPYFNTYNGEKCQAWCNEEGKLKGYEVNPYACAAWDKANGGPVHDILVGDICILTGDAMLD